MSKKNGYSRRDFLKVVGATSGLAAAGCGEKIPEKLIPYVIQPDEVIPGVASWYAGSCSQCSAGCGTLVRVREGRAVKVEGNQSHPINKGGLCALGQSSLQTLYDPDRVREPLKRPAPSGGGMLGAFESFNKSGAEQGWRDAIEVVSKAVANGSAAKNIVLLTAPLSGSIKTLIGDFAKRSVGFRHVEFSIGSADVIDAATEVSFGPGLRAHFDFGKADVIVSFGADYLESWLSPVQFARAWASRRKPVDGRSISYCVQVEPRFSLTAANADQWVRNAPNSEAAVMTQLLSELMKRGAGSDLSGAEKRMALDILGKHSADNFDRSGVKRELISELAGRLLAAKSSLVVAGGAATSGDGLRCAVLANVLNAVLGNIGKTVKLQNSSTVSSGRGAQAIRALIADMQAGKVGTLIVSGVNPAYVLPESAGFKASLVKVDTVVALSTNLDETTNLGTVVLPLSTSFESWSDSEPMPGVFNLNQPSMRPIYSSLSLGDFLIALGGKLDLSFDEAKNFEGYIKSHWKKRTGGDGFESRWIGYIERGGDWSEAEQGILPTAQLASDTLKVASPAAVREIPSSDELVLVGYPSVNSFDGASANRPWMQELPNPLTSAVWGSWVELNPKTAERHGLAAGDSVDITTAEGRVRAPVYLNKYIHERSVAVPIGQGHENLGRYANGVGANVLKALPLGDAFSCFVTNIRKIEKSPWDEKLVMLQGSDTQLNRHILRTVTADSLSAHDEHGAHEGGGHHGGHSSRETTGPKPEPGMMYKQMEHPEYRWGMSIDLASCTGCSACVVACYAENNIPVVGKEICNQGREMSWIRIDRYFDGPEEQPLTGFMPMLCQHCGNAPCEPVCPVYATYHNEEGLNAMVYNRCVGTRYCSNNCTYKVRRFNWFKYDFPEPLTWQLNPDVSVREVGIMEKCSFCVQRIKESENLAKNEGRKVRDGEIQPACASSCPTEAITFGNLLDSETVVAKNSKDGRGYRALDEDINTQPAITYLARIKQEVTGEHS